MPRIGRNVLVCLILAALCAGSAPAQIIQPTFEQADEGEDQPDKNWPSSIYAPPLKRETLNDFFFWMVPENQLNWPAECDTLLDEYQAAYTDLAMHFHDESTEHERKRDERFKQGIQDDPAFVRDRLLQILDRLERLERMDHRFLQDFADSLAAHNVAMQFSVQSAFDRRARMTLKPEMVSASNHEALIDFWELARECEWLVDLYTRNPAFIENYSRDYAEAARKQHEFTLRIIPRLAEAARAGDTLEGVGAGLEREQAAIKGAVGNVNRQYYHQAMDQLVGADAYALHRVYYSTAFPTRFKRRDMSESKCAAALRLSDLSGEQEENLRTRLGTYRRIVIEKEQEYLYLWTEGRSDMLTRISEDQGAEELKSQLTRFRERLDTIANDIQSEQAALEEVWQRILTPAQQETVRNMQDEND